MIKVSCITTTIAAAAFALVAVPASAETVSRAVFYGDLDLAKPEGIATLDHRIARAVRGVCDAADNSLQMRLMELRCRAETMATVKPAREIVLARAGRDPNLALNLVAGAR